MRIRIKTVPNAEPNADGEWIEHEVEDNFFHNYRGSSTLYDRLTELCGPGAHAVSYERMPHVQR